MHRPVPLPRTGPFPLIPKWPNGFCLMFSIFKPHISKTVSPFCYPRTSLSSPEVWTGLFILLSGVNSQLWGCPWCTTIILSTFLWLLVPSSLILPLWKVMGPQRKNLRWIQSPLFPASHVYSKTCLYVGSYMWKYFVNYNILYNFMVFIIQTFFFLITNIMNAYFWKYK